MSGEVTLHMMSFTVISIRHKYTSTLMMDSRINAADPDIVFFIPHSSSLSKAHFNFKRPNFFLSFQADYNMGTFIGLSRQTVSSIEGGQIIQD